MNNKVKRLLSIALVLVLLVSAGYADGAKQETPMRNLYIGENQSMIDSATGEIAVDTDVDTILGQNADCVYYVTRIYDDNFDAVKNICVYDFAAGKSDIIANRITDAVYIDSDKAVYYLTESDNTKINVLLADSRLSYAVPAGGNITSIEKSIHGLIVRLDTETKLYQGSIGIFSNIEWPATSETAFGENYELMLLTDGSLAISYAGNPGVITPIETMAKSPRIANGSAYYLRLTGNVSMELVSFDPLTEISRTLVTMPATSFSTELAVSEKNLFIMNNNYVIFSVNAATALASMFSDISSLYAETDGYTPVLEAVKGKLLVYDAIDGVKMEGDSFVIDFDIPDESDKPASTPTPEPVVTPEPVLYRELERGDKGDDVADVQQKLTDLGFMSSKIDGVFGRNTAQAVKLMQEENFLEETGKLTEEQHEALMNGEYSAYDPYKQLAQGDKGERVQKMQQQLRNLGYLAYAADGIFGTRTLAAVELFQEENDYKATGIATSDMLKDLYSSEHMCESYIDLYQGDSGIRVKELNQRLKELYYITGDVSSSYSKETVNAIKTYQSQVGLKQTGSATAKLQKKLFAKDAPEYDGYVTLQRGDSNSRVRELQTRLKKLGYLSGKADGVFGRATEQAVKDFQHNASLKETGIATVKTQEILFSKNAPDVDTTPKPTATPKPTPTPAPTPTPEPIIIFEVPKTATVTDKTLQVFVAPSKESSVIGQLKKGKTVTVYGANSEFGLIFNGNDDAGYILLSGVKFNDEPQPTPTPTPEPTDEPEPTPTPTPEPTDEPEPTPTPTPEPTDEPEPTPTPTPEPTDEPEPTPTPTPEPTDEPEPTPTPTPEPTEEPDPSVISVVDNEVLDLMKDWLNVHYADAGKEFDRKSSVVWLQDLLLKNEYIDNSDCTGVYNAATQAAVLEIQKENFDSDTAKIKNGIVDEETLELIVTAFEN